MFSGIITNQAKIKNMLWNNNNDVDIKLKMKNSIPDDLAIGESIAVNGACMTITAIEKKSLWIHVMNESLQRTNLKFLKVGDIVNCEFAITLNTRLNGHIVTGHIDSTIELLETIKDGQAIKMVFQIPQKFMKYIIYKGSVAINGVSLTISSVDYDKNIFSVHIIPHTQLKTNLFSNSSKIYNVECDILIKTLINNQECVK